jgi:hypothetical protein
MKTLSKRTAPMAGWAVAGVALAAGLVLLSGATRAREAGPDWANQPSTASSKQGTAPAPQPGLTPQRGKAFVRSVRVFVHPDDIYPLVARVKPGLVAIQAENQMGSNVTIVIEKLLPGRASQLLGNVATIDRERRATGEFALGAGEYEFYEQSRPEVRGKLIVAP